MMYSPNVIPTTEGGDSYPPINHRRMPSALRIPFSSNSTEPSSELGVS